MTFLHFLAILVAAPLMVATLPLLGELTLVCVGNLLPRRGGAMGSGEDDGGILQIIVPAHNEESSIADCIRSLALGLDERSSILVIAHNCSDRTAERAKQAGAGVLLLDDSKKLGKGYALIAGMERAVSSGASSVMVFDADSIAASNLVSATRTALSHGADAVQCRYDLQNSGMAGIAFRAMNHVRARGRSGWGLSCGIFGNGFTLRARVLQKVPYRALSIAEDLEYHLALVQSGIRVRYAPEAIVLGEPAAKGTGSQEQRARWEGGRLNLARAYAGTLAKAILQGRLTLIEPFVDLCSLPLAYAAVTLVVLSIVQRGYGVALLSMVFFYLGLAVASGENPGQDLIQLLRVPIYILWKMRLSSRVLLRSRSNAEWVRTEREADPEAIAVTNEAKL